MQVNYTAPWYVAIQPSSYRIIINFKKLMLKIWDYITFVHALLYFKPGARLVL